MVESDGDPLFVWQEAIVLGSKLQQLGINKIEGNLILVGNWQMNYKDKPLSPNIQIEGTVKKSDRIKSELFHLLNVPREEILLHNGSDLGVDNRISPRGACRMFMALETQLEGSNINIGDLFPVAGVDKKGTVEYRNIPYDIPLKTISSQF